MRAAENLGRFIDPETVKAVAKGGRGVSGCGLFAGSGSLNHMRLVFVHSGRRTIEQQSSSRSHAGAA
jgi:hypothetical protein